MTKRMLGQGVPPVASCHGPPRQPHLSRSISGPVSGIPTAQTPRTGPNRPAKWSKSTQSTLHNYLLEWTLPEALWGVPGIFVHPSMEAQQPTALLGLWKAEMQNQGCSNCICYVTFGDVTRRLTTAKCYAWIVRYDRDRHGTSCDVT